MTNPVDVNTTTIYGLQRDFGTIRDIFGVNLSTMFEDVQDGGFHKSTMASFTFDAITAAVGCVTFDLAFNGD